MILLPQVILLPNGEILREGAVRVESGKIIEVGSPQDLKPKAGEEIWEGERSILSPGLINAHCHLDYTEFRWALNARKSFADWIRRINALKRELTVEDYRRAIVKGYRMLLKSGTTTVANIAAIPEVFPLLDPPPLRIWWFLELIDLRARIHDDAALMGALRFFDEASKWRGGVGLSPHATYTASLELFRLVKKCCESQKMLFTTHIAESDEEEEMFLSRNGKLYEFLSDIGRDMSDCGIESPFSRLYKADVLGEFCLAVHMNYLSPTDFERVARSGVSVVHCPKCHAYFGHQPFPYEWLRDLNVTICLGTDSLASNDTLDMRLEVHQLRKMHPTITAREGWEMITLAGAKALRQEGLIGAIQPGAFADLMAVEWDQKGDPHEAFLESKGVPQALWVEGVRV